MNKIKNTLKKILDIPIHYTLVVFFSIYIFIYMITSKQLSWLNIFIIIILFFLAFLYTRIGITLFKNLINLIFIIYITSLYSYFVSSNFNYIIQPFLLSVASITAFLALTYSSYIYNLRNRFFGASILLLFITFIKVSILFIGYSYLFAEIVGLNFVILYMLAWHTWITKSKKTKIHFPEITQVTLHDKYKYIYIKDNLDTDNNKWDISKNNAYPYIYSEVLKAKENKLTLVIISILETSKYYDIGYIKYNKSNIPYLYIKGKSDKYMNDIINKFELETNKKH